MLRPKSKPVPPMRSAGVQELIKTKRGHDSLEPVNRNVVEHNMARAIDEMAFYEQFKADLLPAIQKAMLEGKQAHEITAMAQAYAAARIASIVALEPDSAKALAAAKDILDRTQGRAIERKELHHKLDKLREEEVDALLISSLSEVDITEGEEVD